MKIIVTVHGFLTPSMTFVYNQIKELENQGNDVLVVATQRLNEDKFPYDNVIVIPESKDLGYLKNTLLRNLRIKYSLSSKSFSVGFRKTVEEFKPDLIHIHFGTHLLRVYDAIRDLNISTLVTFHGYDASQYLRNNTYVRSLAKVMSKTNIFGTTVSKDMKERLGKSGIDTSKIFVNYLGVDVEFYKPDVKNVDNTNEEYIFLQVSNFVEKKGHKYTIEAFSKFLKITNKKAKLILAGDGPLRQNIEKQVHDLEITNHVEFIGTVNKFQVRELMNISSCFVHHSVTADNGDMEGLPTVLMEAMAMGLTCISTYHAGIPEIIDNDRNGYLVREFDIEGIADALNKCSPNNFDTRSVIETKFNLKKNTTQIIDIISKITSDR